VGNPGRPERIHSAYLFPSIVFLLVAQPIVASLSATASEILVIPLAAALVAGVWSLDRGRFWFRLALGLALATLLLEGAGAWFPHRPSQLTGIACLAALGVICAVLGIRWLFAAPSVTVESLLAALSVYLLIGITFGLVHVALFARDPGWYHGVSPAGRSTEIAELVYFSLGTLTTSAYGDVVPAHPLSRLLCNVEAVVGQMYIAVLVATLVGGYAAERAGPRGGGPRAS
jgi:hypothetical protein